MWRLLGVPNAQSYICNKRCVKTLTQWEFLQFLNTSNDKLAPWATRFIVFIFLLLFGKQCAWRGGCCCNLLIAWKTFFMNEPGSSPTSSTFRYGSCFNLIVEGLTCNILRLNSELQQSRHSIVIFTFRLFLSHVVLPLDRAISHTMPQAKPSFKKKCWPKSNVCKIFEGWTSNCLHC